MVEKLSYEPIHESDSDLQSDPRRAELWNGGLRMDNRKARKPNASHPWFYRGRFALDGSVQEEVTISGEQNVTSDIGEGVLLVGSAEYTDEKAEPVITETQSYSVAGILERANLQVTFPKKVLLNRLLKDAGADLSNRSAIPLSQSELNSILRQLK